jgi:hypothetical protein
MNGLVCEKTAVEKQALVQIAVIPQDGGYRVDYYPRRAADTVVFHERSQGTPSPVVPREVRWVVTGMQPNMEVRICAKQTGSGMFSLDEFRIASGCNSIRSGPALKEGSNLGLPWDYRIELYIDDVLQPKATIDPTVVIKNDP